MRPGGPVYTRIGYEVLIEFPTPPACEVLVSARLQFVTDEAFVRVARSEIKDIFDQLRSQLQNVQERRSHPRHRCDMPLIAYPLFTDGQVAQGVVGRLIDVSLGGVRFLLPSDSGSDRMFLQFTEVPAVQRLAVYVRVLRSNALPTGAGVVTVGRFRPDG